MLYALVSSQMSWNIPLLIGLICVALLYAFLLKRFTSIKLYHKQPLLLFLSLFLFYLTIGSPLSVISHLSISSHMIQMSILYFMIPPLFLLGIPNPIFQKIKSIKIVEILGKLFLRPIIALSAFAVLFLMYHFPAFLTYFSQHPFVHNGYLLLLLMLSFSMWWPIAAPDPEQRFYKAQKKRYTFLSGVLLMPACLMLIVFALFDSTNNSFLAQAMSGLCLPAHSVSLSGILPAPFNTKFDQVMAGIFMLGLHKFSLMLTFRLGDNAQVQEQDLYSHKLH